MKKRPIAMRIISFFLMLSMVFTSLPLSAFAAEAQANRAAAQQLAMYMLDLGLVDENGSLIQENSFTLDDGTKFANLDELVEWLVLAEEDDMDRLITVDATGKSATVEWMIEAIAIETEMAMLSNSLNAIAGGAVTLNNTANEYDVSLHNVHLVQKVVESSKNTDVLVIRVGVSDTPDGDFIPAPADCSIGAGIFGNNLTSYGYYYIADSPSFAVNRYENQILSKGSSYLEYKINIAQIREELEDKQSEDFLGYFSMHYSGGVSFVFQSQFFLDMDMPRDTQHTAFFIELSTSRQDTVAAITGKKYKIAATDSNGNVTPSVRYLTYDSGGALSDASIISVIPDSNNKYYWIPLDLTQAVDIDYDGTGAKPTLAKWFKMFVRAWDNGIGDSDHAINLSELGIIAAAPSGTNYANPVLKLYNQDLKKMQTMTQTAHDIRQMNASSDGTNNSAVNAAMKKYAQRAIINAMGLWKYSDSATVMSYPLWTWVGSLGNMTVELSKVYNSIFNTGTVSNTNPAAGAVYYENLEIPLGKSVTTHENGGDNYSDVWLNQVFFCVDYSDNGIKQPYYVGTGGVISMKDNTKPYPEYIEYPHESYNLSPGSVIPINVYFSEPVYGDYYLVYKQGTGEAELFNASYTQDKYTQLVGTVQNDDRLLSYMRTFYYEIQPGDSSLTILGVKADNSYDLSADVHFGLASSDIFRNSMATKTVTDYYRFDTSTEISYPFPADGLDPGYGGFTGMSAVPDANDPNHFTVNIDLNNDTKYLNLWGNYALAQKHEIDPPKDGKKAAYPFELDVILHNNADETVQTFDVTVKEKPYTSPTQYYMEADINLPDLASGSVKYTAEIQYKMPEGRLQKYIGAYAQFTQYCVESATQEAYDIKTQEEAWPSGEEKTVFVQDTAFPHFSALDNGTHFTYNKPSELYWVSDNPEVLDVVYDNVAATEENKLTLANAPIVTVVPHKAGKAKLCLMATNGALADTVASDYMEITVKDNGSPTLTMSEGATVFARQGAAQQVVFVSNLGNADITVENSKIYAALYEVGSTEAIWEQAWDKDATFITIPIGKLNNISVGNTPAYTLKLTANATHKGIAYNLETSANIVVRSKPAEVKLLGLDDPTFVSGKGIPISWQVSNLDETNLDQCKFEFKIEKNGVVWRDSQITDIQRASSGSYTLTPDEPTELKDYYVVTAKAKNLAENTWSIASSTITVYKQGSLDLLVGGEKRDHVILENKVNSEVTSVDPTINAYNGNEYGGLNSADKIAALRAELGLIDTISINYQDYNWSILNDMIEWTTSTGREEEQSNLGDILTINYMEGNTYQPLDSFSYTYYVPQTVMMLCGLRDGSVNVTAKHNKLANELQSTVKVDVNKLQNKLYLFQFTPAIQTKISYVDGLGQEQVVYSNEDGSLALWEPNGIASDLRAAAMDGSGTDWRGTLLNINLKSGEGNILRGDLYPMNYLELRRGATAEFTLLKPDGKPLANTEVTLRGGVYRNPKRAINRDDAYCENAMFAKNVDDPASLDGNQAQRFVTNERGVLTVYMDSSQFKLTEEQPFPGVNDDLRFIFEVQFDNDKYNPEIVVIDTGLTHNDTIRTGSNLVTLTDAAGKKNPVVVVQTVDYYTGRDIDVRRHTGVIGPSPDYPAVQLETLLMLWGVEDVTTEDTGFWLDIRAQETAVTLPQQEYGKAKDVSYPFSSIPLVDNTTIIDHETFGDFKADKRIPMEMVLYRGDNTLSRTLALPFGLVDLSTIKPISTSSSVTGLMVSLAAFGTPEYAYTNPEQGAVDIKKEENATLNLAEDLVRGISLLEGLGAKLGLVRTILMPTADPTVFSGYVWTGYDTTEMAELRYDDNGVYLEPKHLVQDMEQLSVAGFTVGDFQAMADGTYSERIQAGNSSLAKHIFGEGNTMQGWMTAEFCYNFDKGEWQVVTTGGGFTYGKLLEKSKAFQKWLPVMCNLTITVRGGFVISLETAIRYAEQLGQQWDDKTARAVNDYLTSLRINAYLELFAGLGLNKGLVATIGAYGGVEMNNENRYLTRSYLADLPGHKKKMTGHMVQLDGTLGVRERLGFGSMMIEVNLISITIGDQWFTGDWYDIDDYWKNAASGFKTGWVDPNNSNQNKQGRQMVLATYDSGAQIQSRDYLNNSKRMWLGDDITAATKLEIGEDNKLGGLQTNAYPFARPLISDDAGLLVYLSDADSTDVEDVEVRYSLMNGGYPDGVAIPSPADFAGYGDSSLDFDGTRDKAGAIWLRESATLDLSAGTKLAQSQQIALSNGLEVVAAMWDGENWQTTRLTDNGTQEINPIIAVSEDGKAVAAWREVQADWGSGTDANEQNFLTVDYTQNRIMFKIFDGTAWSDEAYTLYNGSTGEVSDMTIEMIGDTAAVAFTVEDDTAENSANSSEIYYAVFDVTGQGDGTADEGSIEDNVKTIRATTNSYVDSNPQLATAGEDFVLGWYSVQDKYGEGEEVNDVGLLVFDKLGAPKSGFPESLSNLVSTASFNGQFTFVKGANSLDELSILWSDVFAGDDNNDVIRAVKFDKFDGSSYGSSAPIEVAAMPQNSAVDHIDAMTEDGTTICAVIQGITYDTDEGRTVPVTYELDGESYVTDITLPSEVVNLYSATETYTDVVEVSSVDVDFATLAINAFIPVNFTITNKGLHAINEISVKLADDETKVITGLNLLPNQSKVISLVTKTGNVIENLPYTVTADFGAENGRKTVSDTLYLDFPDVGISTVQVTGEQDGLRSFIATMYNQSAAKLTNDGKERRVVLGVYSDPGCTILANGKYFAGGTTDKGYQIILTGDSLAAIDSNSFAQQLVFDVAQNMSDGGQAEIPSQGVSLYLKATIEEKINGEWVEMPEADEVNNQKSVTFNSLLDRSNDEPTTMSVELSNVDGKSVANVQIQNNSLQARHTDGHVLAALLDKNDKLLETQNVGNLELTTEAQTSKTVNFSKAGSRVVLSYGEPVADNTNANAKNITVDGLPLTIENFDENNCAELTKVKSGRYLLTVVPENSQSTVTVNDKVAEGGMAEIAAGGKYTIVITAPLGNTQTYELTLKKASSGGGVHTQETANPPEEPQAPSVPQEEQLFDDVSVNDWFYEYVMYVCKKGLMNGTDKDSFTPNASTTRGMIVTVLHRLAGTPEPSSPNPFADVAQGSYYEKAIAWAAEQGIVTGYDEKTFGPNDRITREQMAVILWRYAKAGGTDVSGAADSLLGFDDIGLISEYANEAMLWARGAAIINGVTETTLQPGAGATRAQVAAILMRFCENVLKSVDSTSSDNNAYDDNASDNKQD